MKQYEINNAYIALGKLSENDQLCETDQWKIYKLRKNLRQHVEFYDERKAMLTKKYREFANNDGTLTGEYANEYVRDCNELDDLDIEMDQIDKPDIRLVKGIRCKDIEELENFINFIPPDIQ